MLFKWYLICPVDDNDKFLAPVFPAFDKFFHFLCYHFNYNSRLIFLFHNEAKFAVWNQQNHTTAFRRHFARLPYPSPASHKNIRHAFSLTSSFLIVVSGNWFRKYSNSSLGAYSCCWYFLIGGGLIRLSET